MSKRIYTEPVITIDDVMVENGIASSVYSTTIDPWDEENGAEMEF